MLSLTRSENVLFMDDELNLLTINSKMDSIKKISENDLEDLRKQEKELNNLKESLKENEIIGPLLEKAMTLDQAKAIMLYIDTLNEKNSMSILFLQAARGRVIF
jgi:N-acetyltransferase 10